MNDRSRERQSPAERFGAFSIDEARRQRRSPRNEAIWRRILVVAAVTVVGRILLQATGAESAAGVWLAAIVLTGGWLLAIDLLLQDCGGRRFWRVANALALVSVFFAATGFGLPMALTITAFFLVFRRYRPFRHLTSARRALSALLGLLCFLALRVGLPAVGEEARPLLLGRAWLDYAGWSLTIFWALSHLKLVFGMRLHFLRLKPKLAVCAFFFGVIPFVLVAVISVVSMVGVVGSGRAVLAERLVARWQQAVAVGSKTADNPLRPAFVWSSDGSGSEGEAPSWCGSLAAAALLPAAVVEAEADSARAVPRVDVATGGVHLELGDDRDDVYAEFWHPAADTVTFVVVDEAIWSLRLTRLAGSGLRIAGCRLDSTVLDRIAVQVGGEFGLAAEIHDDPYRVNSRRIDLDEDGNLVHLRGSGWERPGGGEDEGFRNQRFHIGGVTLPCASFVGERLVGDAMILYVQTTPAGFADLFFSDVGHADDLLLTLLAVLAALFVIGIVFALIFGFRITGGITSAVARLDRGTRRLAAGDFDTRIEVPNEDELGDLALSFNEMAAKVERARGEAVARERLEREMATAREIQERLLPDAGPVVPGFEVTGTSIPSQQVGGDYYDFLSVGDGRHGIAIGDISGKGVPAAMLMSNLQASLAGQVIHPSSVAELVGRVNDLIARATEPHMFATFFYGVLDCTQHTFTSCNAGHNPPLLLHADGSFEELDRGGLLVGMLPGQQYEQQTVVLEPGEVAVLYTDGITEAVGPGADGRIPDGEEDEDVEAMFGETALREVILANGDRSAAGMKEAILAAVARHTAGVEQSDDITLVVIKRLAE